MYDLYNDHEFFNYGGNTMNAKQRNIVGNIAKCDCGYEYNPFASGLIDDAWIDKDEVAHFEHRCPKCNKKNTTDCDW